MNIQVHKQLMARHYETQLYICAIDIFMRRCFDGVSELFNGNKWKRPLKV